MSPGLEHPPADQPQASRGRELALFLFLTVALAPVLAVAAVEHRCFELADIPDRIRKFAAAKMANHHPIEGRVQHVLGAAGACKVDSPSVGLAGARHAVSLRGSERTAKGQL